MSLPWTREKKLLNLHGNYLTSPSILYAHETTWRSTMPRCTFASDTACNLSSNCPHPVGEVAIFLPYKTVCSLVHDFVYMWCGTGSTTYGVYSNSLSKVYCKKLMFYKPQFGGRPCRYLNLIFPNSCWVHLNGGSGHNIIMIQGEAVAINLITWPEPLDLYKRDGPSVTW